MLEPQVTGELGAEVRHPTSILSAPLPMEGKGQRHCWARLQDAWWGQASSLPGPRGAGRDVERNGAGGQNTPPTGGAPPSAEPVSHLPVTIATQSSAPRLAT